MSQRNQHLTHAILRKPATTTRKQFQTTWCFGKDGQHAGGARDPAILLDLQKHCGSLKPRQFWQKRSLQHCSNLIFEAVNRLAFWTPKGGPPSCVESLLLKQNPPLIHLRPAKSFVSRAAQGSNCQKWDCQALPLFTLDKAIPRLFSILILIAGATKNGRAKSIRWSVWQPCFWGCDMTLGMPPAASKVHQKQWNHKREEGWHKHRCAELALKACCSNKTQLWSTCVLGRASYLEQRKVPTVKMGLPSATAFHFGQGHSEAVFNVDVNSRRDQKRARQIHTLERVATLFLGLRHDARNAPSCFKSSPETMKPQKGRRMTQTSMCWTVALKACCSNKTHLWSTCVLRRASYLEQRKVPTVKNGIAKRYRFSLWTRPFRGCFQSWF